jgi:hypothetical protein
VSRQTDPDILADLLGIHHASGLAVADLSAGHRRLWTRPLLEQYQPVFVDREPSKCPDIVGNWNEQHLYFQPASIGTEVLDPPQISGAGDTGIIGGRFGGWGERYGTSVPELKAPTAIIDLFAPFLASAWGSLVPQRGTLIVKMADEVKSSLLRWQPYYLWLIAKSRGWHDCDRRERERAQLPHNQTTIQRHIRRPISHWLVFHNFEGCPGSGIVRQRRCAGCQQLFPVTRPDRLTCGDTCRQRVSRIQREQAKTKRDRRTP